MTVDLFGLKGKNAIVWGGGSGMGEASVLKLAAAGCNVAVVDLELELAQGVADKVSRSGTRAVAIAADATEVSAVEEAVKTAEEALGPLDVMVTVIGRGVWAKLVDMTDEQWAESHRLNLASFFFPARCVARSMIRNGRAGAIVAVTSVSGLTSAPNHAGYGAAKAGMINLVRTMAVEWGPHNIRVNAIAPGAFRTERVQFDKNSLAFMKERLPLGRPGEVEEIGKAALFLVSDLASYVSGHTLPVEGGWMSTFLMGTPHG